MSSSLRARLLFWDGGRVSTINDRLTVSTWTDGALSHLIDLECVDENFNIGCDGRTGKFAPNSQALLASSVAWKPMPAHELSFEFRAVLKLMGVEI